jgi:hypothetical protein
MTTPSAAHQSLVMWAIRKMQADGFTPVAYDGCLPQFDCLRMLLTSPNLYGLRPDAFGYSYPDDAFALAEAKTVEDLQSVHTKLQLRHYKALIARSGRTRIYLAVPRSAALILDYVLKEAGLLVMPSIKRLHIPDCFIFEGSVTHA